MVSFLTDCFGLYRRRPRESREPSELDEPSQPSQQIQLNELSQPGQPNEPSQPNQPTQRIQQIQQIQPSSPNAPNNHEITTSTSYPRFIFVPRLIRYMPIVFVPLLPPPIHRKDGRYCHTKNKIAPVSPDVTFMEMDVEALLFPKCQTTATATIPYQTSSPKTSFSIPKKIDVVEKGIGIECRIAAGKEYRRFDVEGLLAEPGGELICHDDLYGWDEEDWGDAFEVYRFDQWRW